VAYERVKPTYNNVHKNSPPILIEKRLPTKRMATQAIYTSYGKLQGKN